MRFRFGLRTVLVVMALFACCAATIGRGYHERQARLAAISQLKACGVSMEADETLKFNRWEKFVCWLSGDESIERAYATEAQYASRDAWARSRFWKHPPVEIEYPEPLSDKSVRCLALFPELNTLLLDEGGSISAEGYSQIGKFPNLRRVYLTGKSSDLLIGGHLKGAPSLKYLSLSKHVVDAKTVSALNRISGLKRLSFSGCKFLPEASSDLSMSQLEELQINACEVDVSDVAAIGRQQTLLCISWQAGGLTTDLLKLFVGLPRLRDLHIGGQAFGEGSIDVFLQMPALEFLAISGTDVSAPQISRLMSQRPDLVITCDGQMLQLSPDEQRELSRRYAGLCQRRNGH